MGVEAEDLYPLCNRKSLNKKRLCTSPLQSLQRCYRLAKNYYKQRILKSLKYTPRNRTKDKKDFYGKQLQASARLQLQSYSLTSMLSLCKVVVNSKDREPLMCVRPT